MPGNLFRGEFGADLLAGIAIVTATTLGDDSTGALVALMLSGGQIGGGGRRPLRVGGDPARFRADLVVATPEPSCCG